MNEIERQQAWIDFLHRFREREMNIAFEGFSEGSIDLALELGAGDGFQSKLLKKYVKKIIATDYSSTILNQQPDDQVTYSVKDAELIGSSFDKDTFDLVYSSNLLEHLPNIQQALKGIREVMKPEGLAIQIVPSFFWKCANFGLYYFYVLWLLASNLFSRNGIQILLKKIKAETTDQVEKSYVENNPKLTTNKKPQIDLLFPAVHGVSENNMQEFLKFRKSSWIKEFNKGGFVIIKIMKGPLSSGYGFRWNSIRLILEKMGFTSEYIFYLKKQDGIETI